MEYNRNTYFSAFYHIVFSTKDRQRFLEGDIKTNLLRYMVAFVKNNHAHLIIVNGMPDHIHMLIHVSSPSFLMSDFVRELKKSTNKVLNQSYGFGGRFKWQSGYYVQSLGRSQVDSCYHYNQDQELHHRSMSFDDEWDAIMKGISKDETVLSEKQ